MRKIINAPSLANCSFLEMGKQVAELAEGGSEWFHVDIMDGHYVPNLCFPVKLVRELKAAYPGIAADVHLMTTSPKDYIAPLAEAGADYVSFHADSTNFARRLINEIKAAGMKAGVVINPSQSVEIIEPYAEYLDYAVLMTVEPGFAGQKFMDGSLPRLKKLTELRKDCGHYFLISIDGGVDKPNSAECVKLGADALVTGIYTVFNQPEGISEACRRDRRLLEDAAQI